MKKLSSQQKRAKLRKRCDRLLQEVGRKTYDSCYVCGRPMSVLHHFITKGRSNRLRYDWDNLIPICNHCHSLHHSFGDSTIHALIQSKKGDKWVKDLILKKGEYVNISLKYYEDIISNLEKL